MTSKPRIGVYPGTFDPITLGHLDIVNRALKLVDKLVIGVTTNPAKAPMFNADERIEQIKRETAGLSEKTGTEIEVVAFDILLMDFAVQQKAGIIIRGLRAVSDFESPLSGSAEGLALFPQKMGSFTQPLITRTMRL